MVQVVGKYEHVKSEGFEEYLKTVGGAAQAEAAKAFASSKPTFEVVEKGDEFVITVTNEGKTASTTFKLGVPYDETMPHGAVLKVRQTHFSFHDDYCRRRLFEFFRKT